MNGTKNTDPRHFGRRRQTGSGVIRIKPADRAAAKKVAAPEPTKPTSKKAAAKKGTVKK